MQVTHISNLPVYPFPVPNTLPLLTVVPKAEHVFQWVLSKIQITLLNSDYGIFVRFPNGITIPYSIFKEERNDTMLYNVMFREIDSCITNWKGHQCHCGFCCAYIYRSHSEFYLQRAYARLQQVCAYYKIPYRHSSFAYFPVCSDRKISSDKLCSVDSVPILVLSEYKDYLKPVN